MTLRRFVCFGSALGGGDWFRASLNCFPRAFDREALFVEEMLDFKDQLDVLTPV